MARLAMDNTVRSLRIISQMDFSEKSRFEQTEEELDYLNRALVNYVVRLSGKDGISDRDHVYLSTTYRSVSDIERIGDYAENIVEYAEALVKMAQHFSDDALQEINQIKTMLDQLFDEMLLAYRDADPLALVRAAAIEEQTDEFTARMEENHIVRLGKGVCTPGVGAQYLSLASDVERIADHMLNVARTAEK